MLQTTEPPYRETLENGLTLRTVIDPVDVERVADFNAAIHGAEVGPMVYNLLHHHPKIEPHDQVFVENAAGEIVSSLCLIPWTWRIGAVDIPVGEMGVVGTHEAYRDQGLVRAQVAYFKRRLQERGCLLSCIQGIPYFYRQFGYTYALPLEGGWRLDLHRIPAPIEPLFRLRLATPADLPQIRRLYAEAADALVIRTVRDDATWRYLFSTEIQPDAMTQETWVVHGLSDAIVGYVRIPEYHFGDELVVSETSHLGFEAASAVLHHLQTLAEARGRPAIRLNVPVRSELVQLARAFDAHDLGTYAWQIHIPDAVALLRALRPVLEQRLAHSMFAQLRHDLCISLYRESIWLRFQDGKLSAVEAGDNKESCAITLPASALAPLVLGDKTWRELRASHPDVNVKPLWRPLADVLFPKLDSFLYTSY